MDAQVKRTKAEQGYISQFETGRENLPGGDWARTLRNEAFDRYSAAGLPHRRVEEWKYTDLRGVIKEAYPPAPPLAEALNANDIAKALGKELAGLDCHRLVVVDGHYRPELSDVGGLGKEGEIRSLADALATPSDDLQGVLGQTNPQTDDAVVALNTALMTGGVTLRISGGAKLDKPVHIVHVFAASNAASVTTRNVVSVGAGARATLLESYVFHATAPGQRNTVTELIAGDGSEIDHVKFQNENPQTAHLTSWMTRLGADVTYRAFQFSLGGAVARNQIFIRFAGEGSLSHVSGAVLGRGKQHNDTTLVIDHAVPACESREFNKLVLDDEARGIIQCKVNVHRDAQKSDGHQMAQALMLSQRAEFDSKPELEIFADDVVCGHGSTSGQVDEDLLFYLRSRGIPETQARALLITAFVGEVIGKVENEKIGEAFMKLSEAWLAGGEA